MDGKEKFLGTCRGMYASRDLKLIEKAVDFIGDEFRGKKEFSNMSIFDFNLEVGSILVMSKLPVEVVVAGLLYGIENEFSFGRIEEEFGVEISGIVFGQLQFRKIRGRHEGVSGEVFRKILLSGLDDVRIVFVKLAVKLSNLRIIEGLGNSEQVRICRDVLDIYVPLASRLGLDYMKSELENLAFSIVHPKKHKEILNFFKESRIDREKYLNGFILNLKKLLGDKVHLFKIKGRDKSIRSIHNKILKGKSLKKQRDHFAVRIIVKSEKDCYSVLGILHEVFVPAQDRLKDYIASPKPNGYQSIHTVIKVEDRAPGEEGREDKEVEVQIRTREMDEFAEEGGASHWDYKGVKGDASFEKKIGWLRAVLDNQRDVGNKEFMDNLKLDLFADKIYCYTPKGDVRELPTGATLLDFAYSIHQEVGERAVGGRIDGKFVSLKEKLKNGAVVEILTNKNQRPRRDWLKFVISSRAKSKIRKGIRRYEAIPVPKKSGILIDRKEDFASMVEYSEVGGRESGVGEFSFAKCCCPVPRNDLIGIAKSHHKVLVHRADCEKVSGGLKNAVMVEWKNEFNRPLGLHILCSDRSGILADLLNNISRLGFVVKNANAKVAESSRVECSFRVIPRGVDEVERMVSRIGRVRGVLKIWFE